MSKKVVVKVKKKTIAKSSSKPNSKLNSKSSSTINSAINSTINPNKSSFANKELNNFLMGGFPKGSAILLAGSSGTGKTVFSMQWLFEGAKIFGERGAYITLTEPVSKIIKNLDGLEFYDPGSISSGQVQFIDLRTEIHKRDLLKEISTDHFKLLDVIEEIIKKTGAQRLVIDSITAVCLMMQEKQAVRNLIFSLGTSFNALGCTTLLTSEVQPDDQGYSLYGVEEFISDGLLKLEHTARRDTTMRTMQLLKLRGVEISSPLRHFRITSRGLELIPRVELTLTQDPTKNRVKTGVEGLDKMTHGGFWEGSSTLISGASGTGKSLLGLQFIIEGLKKKEKCLLIVYEESLTQVYRNCEGFGWDLKKYVNQGLLRIVVSYPEDKPLDEHLMNILKWATPQTERLVIDSLSRIAGTATSEQEYRDFVKRLNAYVKRLNIATIYTHTSAGLFGADIVTQSHISTITDSIILLKYVEIEGEIRRMISVMKIRGSDHDKKLREFVITNKGLVIGEPFKEMEGLTTGVSRRVIKTETGFMKEMYTLREKMENKEISPEDYLLRYNQLMQEKERVVAGNANKTPNKKK
jgi:circadian clock protein KaiC